MAASTPEPVRAAILLAGGESRRMGRDKAALPFGEAALGALLAGRLLEVFSELVVVTNGPAPWAPEGATVVGDRRPGRGPLEGLASGLAALRHDRALVVACDMPFVEPPLLRFLAAQPDDADAVVTRGPTGLEPLLALYPKRLLPRLEVFLAGEACGMRAFLATIYVREIPEAARRPYDPTGRALWNLNRPEDYERALAVWRAGSGESP